jgi:imidazolonepropionase-like amidohydrolase
MDESMVLRAVTVVDTRDGSLAPGRDVTISGGRITGVAPTGSAGAGADTVVEASGRYLIPGLCDMHAHPLNGDDLAGSLALMLANGITGFRQMAGTTDLLRRRRAGDLALPADAPTPLALPGEILTPANAGTSEAAVATVREQHADGADFIKVGFVTRDVLYAVLAEGRRLGIPIAGHLPSGVDVRAASRGGMRAIEHLGPGSGILAGCSPEEADITAALAAAPPPDFPPDPAKVADFLRAMVINPCLASGPVAAAGLRRSIDTFSAERAAELAARFAADGTWQVPTLIRARTSKLADAPEYAADPNLRYVPGPALADWRATTDRFTALPAETRAAERDSFAMMMRLTKLFDDAGVRMLAGSDACGAGWEVPGFALHQEFDLLSEAGLAPPRVLRMATLDAAEFLGTTATMGTVEVGRNADLVLLGANPVERVEALHDVQGVVRAGRHYDRRDLDAITERVAARNAAD